MLERWGMDGLLSLLELIIVAFFFSLLPRWFARKARLGSLGPG